MEEQRRSSDFIESLSKILVVGAFVGGYIVLLDIKFALTVWGQVITIGGDGFDAAVKGVVLQSMLITGFAAVVGFWLGTTKQGQDQSQSMNKIAETAAPTTAMAVAAARSEPAPPLAAAPIQAEQVNVETKEVNVNQPDKP